MKTATIVIDDVPTYSYNLTPNMTFGNIKNSLQYYHYHVKRFFLNPQQELDIFDSNSYDDIKLDKYWNAIINPTIIWKNKQAERERFTGVKDADLLLMKHMEDNELLSLCSSNKYLDNLCEDIWIERIKPSNMSWKEYYFDTKKYHVVRVYYKYGEYEITSFNTKKELTEHLINFIIESVDEENIFLGLTNEERIE